MVFLKLGCLISCADNAGEMPPITGALGIYRRFHGRDVLAVEEMRGVRFVIGLDDPMAQMFGESHPGYSEPPCSCGSAYNSFWSSHSRNGFPVGLMSIADLYILHFRLFDRDSVTVIRHDWMAK